MGAGWVAESLAQPYPQARGGPGGELESFSPSTRKPRPLLGTSQPGPQDGSQGPPRSESLAGSCSGLCPGGALAQGSCACDPGGEGVRASLAPSNVPGAWRAV